MIVSWNTQQLIEGFLNGDPDAHHLIRQWVAVVVRARQLGQWLQPYREDIIQEVMLEVVSNLKADKFSGHSTLKVYIQRIAQYVCINWWRRNLRRPETPISPDRLNRELVYPGNDPYQSIEAAERERRWSDAIRCLPQDYQQLLQMIWGEKKRYRTIAAMLNTTEAVIKQRVHRCSQRLVEAMKG